MGVGWTSLFCPHGRGKDPNRRRDQNTPTPAATSPGDDVDENPTQTPSERPGTPPVQPVPSTPAPKHVWNFVNESSRRATASTQGPPERAAATNNSEPVASCSVPEPLVSKAYLDVVVSDVQQWQTQISSLMKYVSTRQQLRVDEMQHFWQLRIVKLQKQNKELLSVLDRLGCEKINSEHRICKLQEEIKQRDRILDAHLEKRNASDAGHQEEISALKARVAQLQKQNAMIKRLIESELPLEDNSPFVETGSGVQKTRDSPRLRSEIQKLQDKVTEISAQVQAANWTRPPSAQKRESTRVHENDAESCLSRMASSSRRLSSTLKPKTPLRGEVMSLREQNASEHRIDATRTEKRPSRADPLPKNSEIALPLPTLRMQPSWRP